MCVDKMDDEVVVGCQGKVEGFVQTNRAMVAAQFQVYGWKSVAHQQLVLEDLNRVCPDLVLPVVRFFPRGFTGGSCVKTVIPKVLSIEDSHGAVICTRTQLPILLGYAFTVHRAQGLTLDAVCFHSQGLFAYGQLYTALSRVRELRFLTCSGGYGVGMKCADQRVIDFEESIVWIDIDNGPASVNDG